MTDEKLSIVIIEDEPDIRDVLTDTLNESPFMRVVGTADSVEKGFEVIVNNMPDAIFMDIKIKGGDAFRLINILKHKLKEVPPIILNTGYNDFEFAQRTVNDFSEEVVMILRKPFWKDWAKKEMDIIIKITERHGKTPITISAGVIKLKSEYTTHVVRMADLVVIESDRDAKGRGKILLRTSSNKFTIYRSLASITAELPRHFIRVSRFSIINTQYIDSYNHLEQTLALKEIDRCIGVGNKFKEELLAFLS